MNAPSMRTQRFGVSRTARLMGVFLVIVLVLAGQVVHLPTAHSSADHTEGDVMDSQSADGETTTDPGSGDRHRRDCSGPDCGGCIAFVSNPPAVPLDPGHLPSASPLAFGPRSAPDRHSRPPPTLVA